MAVNVLFCSNAFIYYFWSWALMTRTRYVIAVYLSNLSIDEMKQITDGKMAAAKPYIKFNSSMDFLRQSCSVIINNDIIPCHVICRFYLFTNSSTFYQLFVKIKILFSNKRNYYDSFFGYSVLAVSL